MTSEYERKLIDMQYQMRENNAYLNDYLKDLNNWTEDMKKKEESVKSGAAIASTNTNADLPPVRSFVEPPKPKKKSKKKTTNSEKTSSSIRSFDYRGWDKFDVEAECARVDEETNEQDGSDESEEDDDTDEQWQAEVLKQKAEHYKKWGNHHFEKKNYAEAIESYTKAIECNPEVAVYFANRAQCQLFEQRYGACEADCTLAIQLDEKYLKAYYRRALARIQLGKTEAARDDLEYVLAREPTNKDAKTKLDELNKSDEIKRLGRVYPLKDKPVNQRSTKPLKRIDIQEIDTSILAPSEPVKKKSLVIEEVEPAEEPAVVMETSAPPPPPSLPSAPIEQRPSAQPMKLTVVEKPLPIPTTGFQFKRDWNSLNRQVEQQASYFERIPPTSYKTLFSTGLDSSVFSRILSFWAKKSTMDEQLIDSMLELRRTPRFDTQLSFLDQQDKHSLSTLLQRLKTECVSSERIVTILKDYKID